MNIAAGNEYLRSLPLKTLKAGVDTYSFFEADEYCVLVTLAIFYEGRLLGFIMMLLAERELFTRPRDLEAIEAVITWRNSS